MVGGLIPLSILFTAQIVVWVFEPLVTTKTPVECVRWHNHYELNLSFDVPSAPGLAWDAYPSCDQSTFIPLSSPEDPTP